MENSPWNIAARFDLDMSFSVNDIVGMLTEYETDYHTGMDVGHMADLIYSCTAGYPYLVSALCKYMDEEIPGMAGFEDRSKVWTKEGFHEAEMMLIKEDNTLYQSMLRKLKIQPELRTILYELIFIGNPLPYTATNEHIKDAVMFGFIRNEKDMAVIFNKILESVLYNYFISEELASGKQEKADAQEEKEPSKLS